MAKLDNKSTLVIAGSGEDTDKLNCLVKRLAISDKIKFTGPLTHLMLCELYQLSDVYIQNPKSDALPYSMLESIACGTPIICGLLGSISDVIGSFEEQKFLTSFYYNEGVQTDIGLSQLLEQAFLSSSKYFNHDVKYRDFIETNYSTNSYTNFVLNIYRDMAVKYAK
jgi:glycosyltransferase involved in cell wall biosynthesis